MMRVCVCCVSGGAAGGGCSQFSWRQAQALSNPAGPRPPHARSPVAPPGRNKKLPNGLRIVLAERPGVCGS